MAAPATREVKVGLFVFIAFVLLAVVVFSISDFYTSQAQYTYPLRLRFNFVNGIEVGAPVRVSGVHVGEVRAVRVYRDEANQQMQVEVGARISRDAPLEEDSVAYINTLGLLGEKYVEIVPGTPGARLISPGEILAGRDSVSTEKMMESGYGAVRELEKAVAAVNSILGDPQTQENIRATLGNSQEAMQQLTLFLSQANAVMGKITRGEGTIGRLLTQDDLYHDLKELTADLKAHPWKLFFGPKEKKK